MFVFTPLFYQVIKQLQVYLMSHLARKLERCSRVKESIAFYSHKNSSMQYCESRLEAHACLVREFNPSIKQYLTQPTSFKYEYKGKLLRYTPDALVQTTSDQFYYEEVKPQTIFNKPKNLEKYRHLQAEFDSKTGRSLVINHVVDDTESFKVENLTYLYPFLQLDLDQRLANAVTSNRDVLPVGELVALAKQYSPDPALPMQLIAHGHYVFSSAKFLTTDTLLEASNA